MATSSSKNPKEREEKIEKAMRYLETVRNAFEKDNNPAKYDEFVDVLADFRKHRIGTAEVESRVRALFRDRPSLLAGFNVFLPDSYKTRARADELAARVATDLTLDDQDDDHMIQ